MDSNLSVTIMFVAAFSAVAIIISSVLNYHFKNRVIKSGLLDKEGIKLLNQLNGDSKIKALKWGLLLFFGGVGLVVLQFIPFKTDSPLPYGIESIFIAIGFFIYYFLISKRPESI